ncbi:TPA: transcriptional regulator CsgD [Kluyvera ascorbata]|uniref:Transcriptional regulator CsgD n=1 Tax=Kluyvera genomosp. 2 TaxID=2774054 RepID=A0A2T2Y2Y0_9ENTR|nr:MULTISPECIES: biofilm master transcriptional regulator CsgD [Enterobacteriaceae]HAT3920554.1 transcriptional regulator CsgD [Kluyvera ascorbata]PSR46867.1 transcriptional regulator CsgD [Kluyvera genomosp. 2]BBQ84409.1 transcriptional regulator CsgD [Klebsiella sp. WP3-W18-ESBL-02]BBR21412.1 transcriptional regulator CsgD [Klebsiella sp. WP3-S18-ESBL-05]BBR58391.1 transcriptional regulator CsgD [Klebsiella sp. WP4-W18-ESBL-05]
MAKELTSTNQTLSLVTRPSLQSCALSQNLKKLLRMEIKIVNIHLVNIDNLDPGIILFDMMDTDRRLMKAWQEALCKLNNGAKLLLFNTPEEYSYPDIEAWPHISGIFYEHDEEHFLVKGLQKVMEGECYFSRKLASYLIMHSGNYRYDNSESTILTYREKEILNKLRIGASNLEIARALFISESTVKTHLYHLFKKIAVKNRTQAVSWANDNFKH